MNSKNGSIINKNRQKKFSKNNIAIKNNENESSKLIILIYK